MDIANFWTLPVGEQKDILKSNPVTLCAICHEPTIRIVSCDACGESVCFACAIPCGSITVTAGGMSDEVEGTVLCKNCGTF